MGIEASAFDGKAGRSGAIRFMRHDASQAAEDKERPGYHDPLRVMPGRATFAERLRLEARKRWHVSAADPGMLLQKVIKQARRGYVAEARTFTAPRTARKASVRATVIAGVARFRRPI